MTEAQQPLLHEVLRSILRNMTFPVSFTTSVDNGDGTFTLGGITNIHHLQPDFTITINDVNFVIDDYSEGTCTWNVKLKAGSNSLPTAPGYFYLKRPFFFHGTPLQQQAEIGPRKIPLPKDKTPMLYLMEPHEPEYDYSFDSSIDSRHRVTLCFLTESRITQNTTDQFYHLSIKPMNRLLREFISALIASNYFFTDKLKVKPKYHTKFSIWIPRPKTEQIMFSEKLSGASVELYLELYKMESECCCCPIVFASNDGDYNSDFSNDFFN